MPLLALLAVLTTRTAHKRAAERCCATGALGALALGVADFTGFIGFTCLGSSTEMLRVFTLVNSAELDSSFAGSAGSASCVGAGAEGLLLENWSADES